MNEHIDRLTLLRATEAFCLRMGVDALALPALARELDVSLGTVTRFFHDESSLLDAVLERHQSAYEKTWEDVLPALEAPRDVLRLLVRTLARQLQEDDGGPGYVAIATQMAVSTRFALTGRPATTTPAAMMLIAKLMSATKLSYDVIPIRFDRFAVVLFSSMFTWYRQGSSRLAEDVFTEDLVDTLEIISLGKGP